MNSKGFSIAELIVTMGIITIVSTVVFANYKQMGRQTYLENQANQIISDIEEARGAALSAQKITKGGSQVEYFTVTVEGDRVVLFEGADNSQKINNFERDLEIKEGLGYKIGFKAPDPKVIFWDQTGSEIDTNYIDIVINYNNNPEEDIRIRVNKAGLTWLVND